MTVDPGSSEAEQEAAWTRWQTAGRPVVHNADDVPIRAPSHLKSRPVTTRDTRVLRYSILASVPLSVIVVLLATANGTSVLAAFLIGLAVAICTGAAVWLRDRD